MQNLAKKPLAPVVTTEIIESLSAGDMADLCEITETTIQAGGGFGWTKSPPRQTLERYWYGVLMVPERHLMVARLDGVICGAVQIAEPSRHNQAQSFAVNVLANFVAPWARGHDIGCELMQTAENLSIEKGYAMMQLDVRETQKTAIDLYERLGYVRWGENPCYARVDGRFIKGFYYQKSILNPKD
tara:strand:+ start:6187 stop:6744 length:558 start_codon:yes stop_codon:yes gene_type:complete